MPAFDAITAEVPYTALGAYTTRVFAFPTALGIEHRIVNGRVYITAHAVTDPAEVARRLEVFQARAPHYYENWTSLYAQWEQRLRALTAEVDAVTVPALSDFDDAAVVFEARGIAQNHFVREQFHRCVEAYSKMWHHHFEFLMLGYGAYLVFFQF
jgi:pyruvate,water dikinase